MQGCVLLLMLAADATLYLYCLACSLRMCAKKVWLFAGIRLRLVSNQERRYLLVWILFVV